ncbi:MAG: hypothetical protein Q8Q00_03440 [Dehalococcoidia bacterium]|nr:hypothetical protein [Dehalococcoidia bacterium]
MRTEVATGAEARGVRRWLRRVVLPRLIRYLVVMALLILLFGVWRLWSAHELLKSIPDHF